jgi:hypothetical protein
MRVEGEVLTIYQSCDSREGLGQSTWKHNQPQLDFSLPSKTFIPWKGFTTVFSITYNNDIIIL